MRLLRRLTAAEEAQLGKRRGRSAFAPPPLALDSLPLETRRRREAARGGGTGSGNLAIGSAGLSSIGDQGGRLLPVRALPCTQKLNRSSHLAMCHEMHVTRGVGPLSLASSIRACGRLHAPLRVRALLGQRSQLAGFCASVLWRFGTLELGSMLRIAHVCFSIAWVETHCP